MREIPVPAETQKREKIARSLKRKSTTYSTFFYIFLAVAVIGFLGAVIAVIVSELNQDVSPTLAVILISSLLGGGAVGGVLSFLFSRLLAEGDRTRLDFAERCDSEKSFYVGEGTLLTFEAGGVLLHGDKNDTKNIRIPYAEIKLFSVCTRKSPREKGEWSVVFELPAHYLAKNGRAEGSETILVQTDAKERLYRVIEEAGLSLLGEDRSPKENRRYTLKTKFYVPVVDRRRRAIVTMIVGFVVAAAGIPVAIWNIMAGSFLSVIGLFLGLRSLSTFLGAKSVFSVYEEGVFWKDANGDRIFLKWEEIEGIVRDKVGDRDVIKLQCTYGAYHLPDIVGVYEYLRENYPEKCGELS